MSGSVLSDSWQKDNQATESFAGGIKSGEVILQCHKQKKGSQNWQQAGMALTRVI